VEIPYRRNISFRSLRLSDERMAVDDAMWEGCLRNMVDDDDSILSSQSDWFWVV
jgi:hypothetical protein